MPRRSPLEPAERLVALARMIPPGSRVADIGTDHGLLPAHLLRSGRASFCIASEPDARRLARARSLSPDQPLAGTLSLRAGNGLEVLAPEDAVDVVVIAGLGGHAIRRILDHPGLPALSVHRLVLQPQTDAAIVRRWLCDHRWAPVEERLVLARRRFYALVAAEPGAGAAGPCPAGLSRDDLLEAGPLLVRSGDPVVARYWREWLARHERILRGARPGPAQDEAVRQRDLARRILAALPPVSR